MISSKLTLHWNQGRIKGVLDRAFSLRPRLQTFLGAKWQMLEQITFGLFMGSLIALLILLYADVPIIGL